MKPLTLVLGLLAIITAFIAWMPEAKQTVDPSDLTGKPLLKAGGKDVKAEDLEKLPQQVSELRVVTWDDSTSSAKVFEVKKSSGAWIIPSFFDYPADGGSRVGKTAGNVIGVKRGRLVPSNKDKSAHDLHEELGVVDPMEEGGSTKKGRGKRVTLKDVTGAIIVDLVVGNRAPEGEGVSFVREVGDDNIYTAKVDLDISTRFTDWVETDLLKVKKDDLRGVVISDYSVDKDKGTVAQRAQTQFVHPAGASEWTSPETPADKKIAKETFDKLLDQLTGMRLTGVRPYRNEWLQERGFYVTSERKLVGDEGSLTVTAKDGLQYTLFFGSVALGDDEDTAADKVKPVSKQDDKKSDKPADAANTSHNRYMAVFVRYDADKDEDSKKAAEQAAKMAAENKDKNGETPRIEQVSAAGKDRATKVQAKFGKYFYVISDDSFKAMRPALDKLFEVKPAETKPADPSKPGDSAKPFDPAASVMPIEPTPAKP